MTRFGVFAAALSFSFIAVGSGVAQDVNRLSDAEKAKRAAAYAEMSKPGPEHKRLESLVGSWQQEIKYWMEPGKPPITLNGTCENKMILGGRFLVSEARGKFGQSLLESATIMGFDRRHNKYTVIALDTQGTYWVTGAGPYDDAKQLTAMYGEDQDPTLGHTQKYNIVLRFAGPDRYVVEIIFKDEAHAKGLPEFKVVEINHTRVSK